ncbi:MAG: histidine phosphatase family protein [Pseudomonadota bacterium]
MRPKSHISRRFFLASTGAALALPGAARASRQAARNALAAGEAVVYFRHGATTWSGVDSIDWPRARQRLLSDFGIAQSERIGAAFRAQGFPVGEVLASPFARCRDMAEIAFGRVVEHMALIGLLSDAEGREARVDFLRGLMARPTAGGNRIIVSHRSNIAQVAGVTLEEGEAVVLRPTGAGFDVLATFMPQDW